MSGIFGVHGHCNLLLALSQLFADLPSFAVARDEHAHSSNTCSLRRSAGATQSNLGRRQLSKGLTEPYEGLERTEIANCQNALLAAECGVGWSRLIQKCAKATFSFAAIWSDLRDLTRDGSTWGSNHAR